MLCQLDHQNHRLSQRQKVEKLKSKNEKDSSYITIYLYHNPINIFYGW
jgi:hypothetical protein